MPTTTGIATEFIQFSRPGATGGGATVTDSDGLIKWAQHNLLINSESFDTTSWTKTTTTVAANSIAAPNGTTTADTLTAAGANSTTLQSYTALAVPYTFGVWLKRKTGTGNIQIAADSGTYTTVTITSDWALYTVSQTPAAGTISAGIRIVTSADEVYVWGAALYRSDLGGMQPNTSAYPFYNPTTPKNLLGYTEDFANAGWSKGNIAAFGSGSISNAIAAPNGLQTADKVVANTTSGEHYIYQSCTGGGKNTFSIYLKAAEYYLARIIELGAYRFYATVNLLTGAITNSGGASFTFAGATDVGNGWWRCEIEHSSSVACTYSVIGFPNTITPTNAPANYTGDGISGIYLWGAQVSDSASLDTYSPVYGAAVTSAAYYGPRRDFNGSTLACNGLLVEESRANLLTQSDLLASPWQVTDATRTVVSDASPAGTSSVKMAVSNTSTTAKGIYLNGTVGANANTASIYAKAAELSWIYLRCDNGTTAGCYFNVATGTKGTEDAGVVGTITPVGNGWYRCTATKTLAAGNGFGSILLAPADNIITFSGTVGQGVLIYGAQLEAGSFATSYIPTDSTTATRTADTASVSPQAFPYSSTEGTLVVAYNRPTAPSSTQVALAFGPVAAGSLVSASGETTTGWYANGVNPTGVVNGTNKVGIAFNSTGAFAAVANGGTAASSSASDWTGTSTSLNIGNRSDTIRNINGYIRQITYLPRRVTNAELQTRTA